MTFEEMCEKITENQSSEAREVNITDTRTVMSNFFKICAEMGWLNALTFFIDYLDDYVNVANADGGEGIFPDE